MHKLCRRGTHSKILESRSSDRITIDIIEKTDRSSIDHAKPLSSSGAYDNMKIYRKKSYHTQLVVHMYTLYRAQVSSIKYQVSNIMYEISSIKLNEYCSIKIQKNIASSCIDQSMKRAARPAAAASAPCSALSLASEKANERSSAAGLQIGCFIGWGGRLCGSSSYLISCLDTASKSTKKNRAAAPPLSPVNKTASSGAATTRTTQQTKRKRTLYYY